MYEQQGPPGPPAQNPLMKDVEIGGRRLSLDIWLTLAAVGIMLLLCAWGAKLVLSPAFDAFNSSFVFGWLFFVFGLFFLSLGYAYFWIGARILARDPVGRWAGVALGATVVLSFLLQSDAGATGVTVAFIILLNAALAGLCAFSPGLKHNEQRGHFADLPTAVALAIVIARAEALMVVYVGASVFPAGKYQARYYLEGFLLVGIGIALGIASRRILDRSLQAAYVVAVIVGGGAFFAVVAQRSQLSFVTFGLAIAVIWGLLGAPSSRAFYSLKPIDYANMFNSGPTHPGYGAPQYPAPPGYPAAAPPGYPQAPPYAQAPPAAQYPPPSPQYPQVQPTGQYPAPGQYPPSPQAPQYAPPPTAPLSAYPPPAPTAPLESFAPPATPAPLESFAPPVPPASFPAPPTLDSFPPPASLESFPAPVEPPPAVLNDGRRDMAPRAATPAVVDPVVPNAIDPAPVSAPAPVSEVGHRTVPRPSTVALPRLNAQVALTVVGRDPIVVSGPVVLGRAPEAPESMPAATPEAVPDTDRSLSRSHLLVWPGANAGSVFIRDLGSANGSFVLEGNGASRRLEPGVDTEVRVGMSLMLGAVVAQVTSPL